GRVDGYGGERLGGEMVGLYPLCAFGDNRVAASIDTPLHAFLPFPHVDHLHPDWAIAIAASANGESALEAFNRQFGRRLVWVPWQRPGFELAMMLRRAVAGRPGCDGVLLGSNGLFTWGDTPRECYASSIRTIDQMGQFVDEHRRRAGAEFGGPIRTAAADRESAAVAILPFLRGAVSSSRRAIAHYDGSPDALSFANAAWAEDLCRLGTSCPDHFLRTRICPLFVHWDPAHESTADPKGRIGERLTRYRDEYVDYYRSFAQPDSPALRDSNPSVVVIGGFGVFGFGKDKREARITSEFFLNAIHVMAGATALEDAGAAPPADFPSVHNYVALPRREAFRIEYWALEEAKLRRL